MIYNHDCRKCSLYKSSRTVCVEASGDRKDVELLIVGEAPGEQEARAGEPFTGRSGQLLRAELAKAGITSYTITNTVKCRPPDNRTPTNEEIKACREYLDAELAEYKPKFVLTLGNVPSKALLKKAKITEAHGQLIPTGSFVGMPAYHPAYALRDPSKLLPLRKDIERLAREMRGEEAISTDVDWKLVTPDTFDQFIGEFRAATEFAFDIETNGLNRYAPDARIHCLGIGLEHRSWVIPLRFKKTSFPNIPTQVKLISVLTAIAWEDHKIGIGHNAKFDNLWLTACYGKKFRLSFDTMLAHHTLDENSSHGLKELSRIYLDWPDYDLTTAEKKGAVSADKLYEYCARDVAATFRLYRVFSKMLLKDKQVRKVFNKLVMPAARAFESIEYRGLTIDLKKMAQVETEMRAKVAQDLADLNEMVGEEINWNSPDQVGKLFFDRLGLEATVLTEKGKPSTGEEALYAIKDQHPVANKLVEYREHSKFLSTYIEGWREYMVGDKLYLSTKLHGTVTGRYSSRLHQVPRDGTIRNLVIAPEGYSFVQADFSQAELRIIAEVSGDVELMSCFRNGVDVHWRTLLFSIQQGSSGDYVPIALSTASKIRGRKIDDLDVAIEILLKAGHEAAIKVDKRWKEGRKKAKGINFGYCYGMGVPKFIEYAKLKYGFEPTMDEAQAIRDAYFHLYNRLEPWHDRQRKLVRLDGEVRTLNGRARRLPGVYSTDRGMQREAERQAINSPIQGFIGDLKAMALVEICETVPPYHAHVVGEVHDSILLNVRTESLAEYLPKIRSIMRHPKLLDDFGLKFNVPIEADLEVGPWGAGKPFTADSIALE